MALQFDPGAYESIFNKGRDIEEANRRRPFDALAQLVQTSGQMRQNRMQEDALALKDRPEKTLGEINKLNSSNKLSNPVSGMELLANSQPDSYMPPMLTNGPLDLFGSRPQQPTPAQSEVPQVVPPQQAPQQGGNFIEQFRNWQSGNRNQQASVRQAGQDPIAQQPQAQPAGPFDSILKNPSLQNFTLSGIDKLATAQKALTPPSPSASSTPYTPAQAEAISSGDMHRITAAFPSGVPPAAVNSTGMFAGRQATQDTKHELNYQKRLKQMGDDLDPSKQRQGSFGVSKQIFDRAERLESLAGALPDGNLDSRQMEELAIGLNSMLSGSNTGASEQVKSLVPQTIWGDAQKLKEWFVNNPTGLQQQEFVKRMLGSISREKQTAEQQMNRTRFSRIAKYSDLASSNPDDFNSVLQSNGVDPEQYQQWTKGGYKAMSAVAKPGEGGQSAKPKTVKQNGHTYTLNEGTGQYE